ncbi:bifunctional folylpolyglutamate synthase/dihydrofolate synthase, partial [Acinetobacter baumannii]
IKVNGELCSKEFVIEFTEKIMPLIESIQPSFFEITVAMAFAYFALQKVDIAVIEVGLGGRLDSTNIIRPELAIITNIGWDH